MNWLNARKNKQGKDIYLITSWDDFGDWDYQLYELLKKYNIPAIFFIPVKELLSDKNKLKLAHLIAKDFVIGSHTVNHPILTNMLYKAEMICEIVDSKKYLEKEFKQSIDCFCYPRGRYNDNICREVANAGYLMARTTIVGAIQFGDNLIMPTSAHIYSGRKEYEGKTWLEFAINLFDQVIEGGGYFHLWGHSKEIQRDKEWGNLEWFLSYINQKLNE